MACLLHLWWIDVHVMFVTVCCCQLFPGVQLSISLCHYTDQRKQVCAPFLLPHFVFLNVLTNGTFDFWGVIITQQEITI